MSVGRAIAPFAALALHLTAVEAAAVSGDIRLRDGAPVGYAFVALMTADMQLAEYAISDPQGHFAFGATAPYIVMQPPSRSVAGFDVSSATPHIYAVDNAQSVTLVTDPSSCLVLRAYKPDGTVMRWQDHEARGAFGGQFLYATNLDDEARPAAIWPAHDAASREQGSPRHLGLPAVYIEPGAPFALNVLFWETDGYGKLLLRADNGGRGFTFLAPGEVQVIDLNLELARTAVADLSRRSGAFGPTAARSISALQAALADAESMEAGPGQARAADAVLARALELRDSLELAAARAAIPSVRMGTLDIDAGPRAASQTVTVVPGERDFHFGVFEGSPYNAWAFEAAREAGFNEATFLLGWNWTDAEKGVTQEAIDQTFGIPALEQLGYVLRAHGVVWLQQYGILPDRAFAMEHGALVEAALAQQQALLDVYGGRIARWEAMNEPASTNEPGLPRELVISLLGRAAEQIKEAGAGIAYVNGPHEADYGIKYLVSAPDGTPASPYKTSYSTFLREAASAGALDAIDAIALQFYPGFHFSAMFQELEGPAFTLGYLQDMLDRYAALGKPLLISEFSVPGVYQQNWTAGYWRGPWDEARQAEYARGAYTLAFAHPSMRGITWWDVSDTNSSVVGGGLMRADRSPKPVMKALSDLMQSWQSNGEAKLDAAGTASLALFAGEYSLAWGNVKQNVRVTAGQTTRVTLEGIR